MKQYLFPAVFIKAEDEYVAVFWQVHFIKTKLNKTKYFKNMFLILYQIKIVKTTKQLSFVVYFLFTVFF